MQEVIQYYCNTSATTVLLTNTETGFTNYSED